LNQLYYIRRVYNLSCVYMYRNDACFYNTVHVHARVPIVCLNTHQIIVFFFFQSRRNILSCTLQRRRLLTRTVLSRIPTCFGTREECDVLLPSSSPHFRNLSTISDCSVHGSRANPYQIVRFWPFVVSFYNTRTQEK